MVRVILYTKDRVLAEGFRSILSGAPLVNSFIVCHALADLHQVGLRAESDVLLVDLTTEDSWGYLRDLNHQSTACRIVVWDDDVNVESVHQLRQFGIRGILRRASSVELTIRCFEKVAAGELWFDREVTRSLIEAKAVHLTNRERQLVMLVAQGLPNKEIGARLGIGEGTVKVYFSKLFRKLGVQDRFELAIHALRWLGKGRGETLAFNTGDQEWPSSVVVARAAMKVPPTV